MRWAIAAAALVVLANGFVLVSAGRERAAPATRTAVVACAASLRGGGTSGDPPALRLQLAPDSLATTPGLDPDGLRALGFDEATVSAVGRARDTTFHWPTARPAWVRLRQSNDSLRLFSVAEVAPLGRRLSPDSSSLVIRGLVGIREQPSGAMPAPAAGHNHGGRPSRYTPGVLAAVVVEVIPSELHLDRRQIAAMRAALTDSAGCEAGTLVIASGRSGGVWVESAE
jgi:hypothetical protein